MKKKDIYERAQAELVQTRLSPERALYQVFDSLTADERREAFVALAAGGLRKSLRAGAIMAVDSPQPTLFDGTLALPGYVWITRDGDDHFISRQQATLTEHHEGVENVIAHYKKKVGNAERHLVRIDDAMRRFNPDVPIGQLEFEGIPCCVCGLPWRDGEDFVKLHDNPVGDGTGPQLMRYGHKSCNDDEGIGLRTLEVA